MQPLPGSSWATAVKAALQPRLLRLPILTWVALHGIVVALHLPAIALQSSSKSLLAIIISPARPTLLLCSSLAFLIGILPTFILRRRILTRPTLHSKYVAPFSPTIAIDDRTSWPSQLGSIVTRTTSPQIWASALLTATCAFLFNLILLASLAAYSSRPAAWSPYQQVPSMRKYTASRQNSRINPLISFRGSIGVSQSAQVVYWRPNEVIWSLALEPFFLALLTTLAANTFKDWPVPKLRVPEFPFFASVGAVQASAAIADQNNARGGASGGSLSARVSQTLPRRLLQAAVIYAALSQLLILIYLPLRLPIFKVALVLLPPYSTLRRLIIPSLQPQYSIYTASNFAWLFGLAGLLAAIQGVIQAVSANLWEIYATHPLVITPNGSSVLANQPISSSSTASSAKTPSLLSTTPVETLLQALEAFGSARPSAALAKAYSAKERQFLFAHALLDLAVVAQQHDQSLNGQQLRRREFWKHFAPSTGMDPGDSYTQNLFNGKEAASGSVGGGTISAWERVSLVLLSSVRETTEKLSKKPQSPGDLSASETARTSAPSSTSDSSLVSASQVVPRAGGPVQVLSAQQRQREQQERQQITTQRAQEQNRTATVWQRLVTPASSKATSESSSQSKVPAVAPTEARQQQQPTKPSAEDPTSVITLLKRIVSKRLVPASPPPDAVSRLEALTPLLCSATPLMLLSLSLQEDEWGTVTLSERRGLGVDAWIEATTRLAKAAEDHVRAESARVGGSDRAAVEREKGLAAWRALAEEINARLKGVKVDFALGA